MPTDRVLCVLGELVVDLIPVPGADAGPEGTAPQYVARPGGNALNVGVAAGRAAAPGGPGCPPRGARLAPGGAAPPGAGRARSPRPCPGTPNSRRSTRAASWRPTSR